MIEKSEVEKSEVEKSGVEKFMVEKSGVGKFTVEKSGFAQLGFGCYGSFSAGQIIRAVINDHMTCYNLNSPKIKL